MKKLCLFLALSGIAFAQDPRVESLLSRMTLTEKLGQLQMLDGDADGTYRAEHPAMIREGRLGSTLNVRGSKRVNELQRIAMEESRLRIPVLFAFDVIHGHRTVFPISLGESATWDPADVELAAQVAAREAASTGLKWTFAPMVDIARDARWGRVSESAGEDTYLGIKLAQARVRGFQGEDPGQPERVLACAKHWVAYGAAEAGRDYNTTDVSERTLREVYFPPFRAAVQSGVGSFMSAFNDLNGIPTSGNPWTLTDVLRGEWKFDGVVVSDYESVKEMIKHRYAQDEADAARLGITAGVDIEMVSRLYATHLPKLVAENKVPLSVVDEAVRRVLRSKFRLGLFERPYAQEGLENQVLLRRDHREATRRVAARSLVLLKNQNTLPFPKTVKTVALLGPLGDDPVSTLGSWSGDGKPADTVTLLQGLQNRRLKVLFSRGVDLNVPGARGNFDEKPVFSSNAGGTNLAATGGVDPARLATTPLPKEELARAVKLAKLADVVVLCVGETAAMSGEAASRSRLDIPGRQLELIRAVKATGKPYVVVLFNGRPLVLAELDAPAVLEAWFPGTEGGNAIADVLFGDVNPGGKLPVTFPRALGQVPLYYNAKSTGRPRSDEKYTSKYLDVPITGLYPFGYGLSYSRFQLSNLKLLKAGDQFQVTVQVQNQGPRRGDEVVQLYVQDVASSVTRPIKELRGFQRVALEPGQKREVTFFLGPQELGFYDARMRWVVEPGRFKIWAANSSEGGLEAEFDVL